MPRGVSTTTIPWMISKLIKIEKTSGNNLVIFVSVCDFYVMKNLILFDKFYCKYNACGSVGLLLDTGVKARLS